MKAIVTALALLSHTEGSPTTGGDYIQQADARFVFNQGDNTVCQNVFVFDDDLFEMVESFDIRIRGVLLEDGTEVPSVDGVTINPDEARVRIRDNDGEHVTSSMYVIIQQWQISGYFKVSIETPPLLV